MGRKKRPVELVTTDALKEVHDHFHPRETGMSEAITRLVAEKVKERVDEIVASLESAPSPEPGQLEPDFQPREAAIELRSRQNVFEQRKWGLYFQKWGCRVCSRKNVGHVGNGHCSRCHSLVVGRLKVLKAQFERDNPEYEIQRDIDRLTSRMRTARALFLTSGTTTREEEKE